MTSIIRKKTIKNPEFLRGFLFNLALPTFPGRHQPSIIGAVDFTAVFGMGTGVSPQLFAPEICHSFTLEEDKRLIFHICTCDLDL